MKITCRKEQEQKEAEMKLYLDDNGNNSVTLMGETEDGRTYNIITIDRLGIYRHIALPDNWPVDPGDAFRMTVRSDGLKLVDAD